jgi:hypothetical protein
MLMPRVFRSLTAVSRSPSLTSAFSAGDPGMIPTTWGKVPYFLKMARPGSVSLNVRARDLAVRFFGR